ncbi:hypothetical protein J6590_020906 [Homalodisca vitripennis]|nr:hypothetical protein J6590_020906 [Homalodisca vitripennis]
MTPVGVDITVTAATSLGPEYKAIREEGSTAQQKNRAWAETFLTDESQDSYIINQPRHRFHSTNIGNLTWQGFTQQG